MGVWGLWGGGLQVGFLRDIKCLSKTLTVKYKLKSCKPQTDQNVCDFHLQISYSVCTGIIRSVTKARYPEMASVSNASCQRDLTLCQDLYRSCINQKLQHKTKYNNQGSLLREHLNCSWSRINQVFCRSIIMLRTTWSF